MSDLNIRFSNCFDFINNTKQYLEANPSDWRNIYTMEDLVRAECDLMEMEIEAAYDAEEYNSLLNGNAFRTAKKANRRKQNKKNKSRDRIHGRRHGGAHGGVDFRYVDCNPFCNKHQYVDAMFATNGKHRHNADRKASAMSAREQDFFLNPSVSEMEIEQEEKRMTEEEERILDNHYMVEAALTNFLKEGKYISLLSYWNGEYWEDSDSESNQFCGIKTAEEVKDAILTEQAKHLDLSEVGMDTVHGMGGVSFKWDSFYGWDDEKRGYVKLTFLPLLPLN